MVAAFAAPSSLQLGASSARRQGVMPLRVSAAADGFQALPARMGSAKPIARRFRSALISAPAILAIALSVLVVAPMVCSAIEINVEDIKAQYDKEQADNKAAKDAEKAEENKAEKITKNANDAVELFYKKDAKVPTHSYEVRDAMLHDPMSFTQGLEIYKDGFLEGTGLYGKSQVRKVSMDGIAYSKINNAKDDFGEGVTHFGKHIMQLTWREKKAFLYEHETLNHEGGFEIDFEGWGACHDEEHVYISDGTNMIRERTPPPKGMWADDVRTFNLQDEDGDEIKNILWKTPEGVLKIPVRLNELEVVEGELWANVWPTETIARIEIATGKLLGWINLEGLRDDAARVPNPYPICKMDVLNGIAVNKTEEGDIHVYVTGKCWPRMYDLLIMEREDCGHKGEILAVKEADLKGFESIDFFQPKDLPK